jgi:hypothetical protein
VRYTWTGVRDAGNRWVFRDFHAPPPIAAEALAAAQEG